MGDSMLSFASTRTLDMYGYDNNCVPCSRRGVAEEVVGYCQDCEENLCENCYTVHCIPTPSANHTLEYLATDHSVITKLPGVTSRDSSTDTSTDMCTDTCTEMCTIHEEQVVEFFSESQKQFGCKECVHTRNIDENALYIPDESKKLNITDVQEKIENISALGRSSEHMFKNVQQTKNLTEQNHQKVIKQAGQFIEELKQWTKRLGEEFTQMAETKRDENISRLSKVAVKYSEASTQCMEMTSIMEALQNNNQNCQLYIYMRRADNMMQSIQDGLNEIKGDNRTTLFKFKPNRNLIQAKASLGKLDENECVGHWTSHTNRHEAILIRSSKVKQTRVARGKRNEVKRRASDAFDYRNPFDDIQESEEIDGV